MVDRRPPRPARRRPVRAGRRVRRADGRQRLGQVDPGPGRHRPPAARLRAGRALRHPAGPVPRVAPDRVRPAARRRRVGRARVRARGRLVRPARPPPAAASRSPGPTGPRIDDALEVVGLTDRAAESVATAVGRAAAAGADRPRPGRRAGRCSSSTSRPPGSTCPTSRRSPTRSACSRSGAPRSCWSPTSSGRWPRWSTAPWCCATAGSSYDGPPLPTEARPTEPHHHRARGAPRPHAARRLPDRHPPGGPVIELLSLPFMQSGAARGRGHRPRGPGRRHLPGAAPAGADGRRHRPRRGHRRRPRPADRHLAHLVRGGRGRPGRGRDRGDPGARPHQRRRRAGAAVLRRPRRRRPDHRPGRAERVPAPGVPVRLGHQRLRRRRGHHRRARGRGGRSSASACSPSCSPSPRTRSSPGWPGSGSGSTTCSSPCSPPSRSRSRCAPSACCWSRR